MKDYGLVVAIKGETLPALDSYYMYYEDNETVNVEDGYDIKSRRLFYINHPELNEFIYKMGENNFFNLHRVFLSYYESHTKLRNFWYHQIPQSISSKKEKLMIDDIDVMLDTHNIVVAESMALKYANYVKINQNDKYIEKNPFGEYMWALQLKEFLDFHNVEPFGKVLIPEGNMFESSYLFKGAVVKKEISTVLYEFANINSLYQADYIKKISNILEIIQKDIERNRVNYINSKPQEVYQLVESLIKQIKDNKTWKKCFSGVFNASDLLGPYSRHHADEIKSIKGINMSSNLPTKDVIESWKTSQTLPNDKQFKKILELWYFTTTFLMLNWLRLPHFKKEE